MSADYEIAIKLGDPRPHWYGDLWRPASRLVAGLKDGRGRDLHNGVRSCARQDVQEILPGQCDAALGRPIVHAGQVHENCATHPPDDRRGVVADDDDDVVEIVHAPQLLMTPGVGQSHGSVVQRIRWIVAPAVVGRQRSDRQRRGWEDNRSGR